MRYFIAIVENGQITKAAEKLHIAQPPLSQQLKQLEAELGVTLFHRSKKRLELTKAGEELYRRAKRWLLELDDIALSVRETEGGLSGTLAIGFAKTYFAYLPSLIHQFIQIYPKIRFILKEGDTFRISEMVKDREIEFGIIRLPFEEAQLRMRPIPADPYVLVAPRAWNLHETVSFRALKDRPLLLLHRQSGRGQYELVIEECRRHGFEPKIVAESPDVHVLLSLVSEGIGATVIPRPAAVRFLPGNAQISHFWDAQIQARAAIVYDPERYMSKAAERFIEMIVHHSTSMRTDRTEKC